VIHIEVPKGQLRITGRVDAEALRTMLEKLLAWSACRPARASGSWRA
jgi:hypothetical protein